MAILAAFACVVGVFYIRRARQKRLTKGIQMTKDETVTQGLAALEQSVKDQLGAAYDAGSAAGGTGINQGAVDAAVAAQAATDAKELNDAQAKAASDLAALQTSLATMTAKEQLEESAVADVSAKINQVQAAFDAIKALLAPAPASV